MQSIILTGYMCVGKTTVGRALAKRLHCTFYDLDWYIEERYHTQVSRIFAEEGEAAFRDKERRMLHEVAAFENVVLSCGGGTPCFFDNADFMNSVGHTFYLKASPDTILQHLAISRGERPLLKDKSPDELRAYITADQLTGLKIGQKVKVYADQGKADRKEYQGTVTWISSKAEFTPKTIQTRDERANLVYAVKIAVKNDGLIKEGMYGDVRF